jgi:hypothetical protein
MQKALSLFEKGPLSAEVRSWRPHRRTTLTPEISFDNAEFSGGQFRFSGAGRWSDPPMFSWDGRPPAGVVLPDQPS